MSASLREAAIDLMDDYASLIDADRLEDWLDLFTEDATYRIVPRENFDRGLPAPLMLCTSKDMLRDRVLSLRQANEYNPHYDRHLVTNIRAKADGAESVRIEAHYLVLQTNLEGQSRLFSTGRYQDRARLEGGRLLFTEKLVIVDTFSVPTLLATPL
jgi:anthranilate 1,2-dioxygenase small subunit